MAEQIINMPVEQQRRLKITLENRFKTEIRKVFATILQDFKVSVFTSLMQPNSRKFLPAWITLLSIHYERTQKAFLKTVGIETKQNTEEEEEEKILLLALLAWREQNVNSTAEELAFTTRVNMAEALQKARDIFAAEGKIPTNRELAFMAAKNLRKKFRARIDNIAITETQKAAESTKLSKVETESGIRPIILGGLIEPFTKVVKIWITKQDNRVRPAHRAVFRQQQPVNKPFLVVFNGRVEKLNYPGDASLGASQGNIQGCRCTNIYKRVKV